MPTFKVRQANGIREVEVPDEFVEMGKVKREILLERIFCNGQNDIQKKPRPSVSVGDVIVLEDGLFMIKGVGFAQVTEETLDELNSLPREERWRFLCDRGLM